MNSQASDFPIVGIGASAGGIKALQQFFDSLPAESGMAFVVIIHMDPEHSSNLGALLTNHTEMPVTQIQESTEILPDHVYLIAPGKRIYIQNRQLVPVKKSNSQHATIDLFFVSLAEQFRERAISVILSGTGNDGTVGLKAIKEFGGVSMAQDPFEAEYDGMLLNAIQTNLVDVVLPLKELAPKVTEFRSALSKVNISSEADILSEEEVKTLNSIFTKLHATTKHDFSHYKRSSVMRRLQRRMQVTGNYSISRYEGYLEKNPREITALFKDLLISKTNFFRDPKAFEALKKDVVPHLFEDKEAGDQVRVWVTGCATGEEAYSIAILLHEYASKLVNPPQIKIFASDISKDALKVARKGVYPASIETDVSEERLKRFFSKESDHYQVNREIQELVIFSLHDLLGDPPFSNLDLAACRNLMIYFNSDMQSEVLKLLHYALRPESYLFLGLADSTIGATELFAKVVKRKGLFRARPLPENHNGLPNIPIWKNVLYWKEGPVSDLYKKTEIQFDKVHNSLLARQHAPASIIINDNNEVMHTSLGVNRFLQFYKGAPSRDLFKLVSPELRSPLRGLIYQMGKKKADQTLTTKVLLKDPQKTILLTVQPVHVPKFPNGFLQVKFIDVSPDKDDEGSAERTRVRVADSAVQKRNMVNHLETELDQVKEHFQQAAKEYETTNEELMTSNEELQSMNEELQTTTEEMETSKEELQSVNEELRIINEEYEIKVDALSKANNDLKNLMDTTEVGILFVDRDLVIRLFTNKIQDLFNVMEPDLGKPLTHITHRLGYDGFISDVETLMKDQKPFQKTVTSGDDRHYLMRLRPYLTTEGDPVGGVISFVEITDFKRAEANFEESNRKLKEAIKMRDDFLSIASHELQTPVTSMKFLVDLFEHRFRDAGNLDEAKQAKKINQNIDQLSSLTRTLLDMSRMQQQELELNKDRFALGELIEETVEKVNHISRHELIIEGNTEMEVLGDRMRIEQVMTNLLSNAIKYSPDADKVIISCEDKENEVTVSIRDFGIGVSKEDHDKVFDRFFKGSGDDRKMYPGFGIGLFISAQIVKRHGGNIWLEPERETGSEFSFSLPLQNNH